MKETLSLTEKEVIFGSNTGDKQSLSADLYRKGSPVQNEKKSLSRFAEGGRALNVFEDILPSAKIKMLKRDQVKEKDVVPAMLTKGEFVFSKRSSSQIGEGLLREINQYKRGGHVSGPGGIDKVGPVMLQAGEFVINAKSVKDIEQDKPGVLSGLNSNPRVAQSLLSGFRNGGLVGSPMGQDKTAATSAGYIENSVTADLNQSPEIQNQSQDSTVTNNINISVNIDKNGDAETSTSPEGASDEYEGAQFSDRIKEAVIRVIREEKRVGGDLY
jgi:hypothetical protein